MGGALYLMSGFLCGVATASLLMGADGRMGLLYLVSVGCLAAATALDWNWRR